MREEGGAGASLGGRRGREIKERRARQQRSLSPGGVREIEGRRGRGSFWRCKGKGTKEEEGIDQDGVSLGPRVTGGAVGPWRPAQRRGGVSWACWTGLSLSSLSSLNEKKNSEREEKEGGLGKRV